MNQPNPSTSWGRYFHHKPREIEIVTWADELSHRSSWADLPNLAYGLGRSYGDSCLNRDGRIFLMGSLNRIKSWDPENGIIRVEAGMSLAQLLEFIVPQGWFLPVTPGTRFVTIGGAVANDVHGKNHHRFGTFGNCVKSFQLLRSDGKALPCSREQNQDFFRATIGGLGLTGIITEVEIQLTFASPMIESEVIPFHGIQEFTSLSVESQEYEYTVAWIDCINAWNRWGRGLFIRGNHSPKELPPLKERAWSVPFEAPNRMLNRWTCKAFNEVYYRANLRTAARKTLGPYQPFFYPLDKVRSWNKIYGSRGFFQYQLVVPLSAQAALEEIFTLIADSGMASFLAVLKTFGDIASPGLLSFPIEGYTLSLDFSNRGHRTKKLFAAITKIVNEAGGRLYPAKDSIMNPEDFARYYPSVPEFLKYKDPHFSSSFWRRVHPDPSSK